MPWTPVKYVEFDENVTPSFLSNNLAGDGEGRFAFAHGARVQCTRRHGKSPGKADFTLAMRSGVVDVLQVFWWRHIPRYARPLLVFVTESSSQTDGKPTLQIWDTQIGKGNRLFCINLESDSDKTVQFGRGIGSVGVNQSSPFLFVGLSTGEVQGFQITKKGVLEKTCALTGISSPVTSVAGDKLESSLVCAADEGGQIAVWSFRDNVWGLIYRHNDKSEDYCSTLGLRGRLVIAGHGSGRVSFHDVQDSLKLAETTTNAKSITGLDVHAERDIILVTGEDCRASVLVLPSPDGETLRTLLSVCLSGVIVGGCFTCWKSASPDITLLLWERSHLIQYEFLDDAASS